MSLTAITFTLFIIGLVSISIIEIVFGIIAFFASQDPTNPPENKGCDPYE